MTTMTMMTNLKKFVEENKLDLENLFVILKNRVETDLTFEDFCNFCYVKTYYTFN